MRQVLTAHSLKYKPDTIDTSSALKKYTSSIQIRNIKLKGLSGLSYIKYQHLQIKDYLQKLSGLKILVDVEFETVKDPQDDSSFDSFHIRSRVHTVLTVSELQNTLQKLIDDITIDIENKALRGSGFTILGINNIVVHLNKYNPTRGASYIPLPEWIANKKACINIKNHDNKCFKYSVQCGVHDMYKQDHPERITHYKTLEDDIIQWNISFPTTNTQIEQFENDNNDRISVNVYRESEIMPDCPSFIIAHRLTKIPNAHYHVDLLLVSDDTGQNHYVYIKDIDRLLSRQINKNTHKSYHCRNCLHPFKAKQCLETHIRNGCIAIEGTRLKLPEKGTTTK